MTRRGIAGYALAAVAVVLAGTGYNAQQRAIGARDERIRGLAARTDSLEGAARQLARARDSLDRLFRMEQQRTARVVTRWRDSVVPYWDTVRLRDTTPVPVDTVRLLVDTAQSTVRQCLITLSSCERLHTADSALHATDTATIATMGRAIHELRRGRPSATRTWAERAATAVLAYLLGRKSGD